ncbi:MAG TPA: hypothetical protein VF754_00695 [Pyrinomonadaceae bacterium]
MPHEGTPAIHGRWRSADPSADPSTAPTPTKTPGDSFAGVRRTAPAAQRPAQHL